MSAGTARSWYCRARLGTCPFPFFCWVATLLRLRVADALVRRVAAHADERLLAAVQHRVTDARRLVAHRADEHHVAVRQRRLEVDDAALDRLVATGRATGLGVPLQDVDALDDDLALTRQSAQDLAVLALVLAGDHHDRVPGGEVEPGRLGLR